MDSRKKQKRICLGAVIACGAIVLILLGIWIGRIFSEPEYYRPIEFVSSQQVSKYLSNHLVPQLHNKSQYGKEFDYVISQQGVSDIIARHGDIDKIHSADFKDIAIAFQQGKVMLMGKTQKAGIDMLFSIEAEPKIDRQGGLYLSSQSVKLGKSSLPFAEKILREKLLANINSFCPKKQIADKVKSMLQGGSVDPVFKVNGNRIRAQKVNIKDGDIVVTFAPAD